MYNSILKQKLTYQKVKNCLNELNGIEVLQIYNEDKKILNLNDILILTDEKEADYKISNKVTESELFLWIKDIIDLKNKKEYYFWCEYLWVKIRIIDCKNAILDMWRHSKCFGNSSLGFIIADDKLTELYDFDFDSRDEFNFICDKYILTKTK